MSPLHGISLTGNSIGPHSSWGVLVGRKGSGLGTGVEVANKVVEGVCLDEEGAQENEEG